MTLSVFLMVLLSVGLSALAQISLKAGMAAATAGQAALELSGAPAGGPLATLGFTFTQPYVLLGLGLYGLGAMVWLLVLAKLDVSMAYPFVALGFIVVMMLGAALFGEPVTVSKLCGTVLVGFGVWLIARG